MEGFVKLMNTVVRRLQDDPEKLGVLAILLYERDYRTGKLRVTARGLATRMGWSWRKANSIFKIIHEEYGGLVPEPKITYQQYIKSPEWKALARQARKQMPQCQNCGGPPEHVHHVVYPDNFAHDSILNLRVLCGPCHKEVHGIDSQQ